MNFFGNSASAGSSGSQTDLGSRLYNLKQISIGNEAMVSILPDDNIVQIPVTTFGKSLLNVQDLNTLVSTLNQGDTALTITDAGVGQIDVKLDNTAVFQWKLAFSQCMNELRTLSIIPTTSTADLGSSASPFRNVYVSNIYQASGSTALTFNGSNSAERMRINSTGQVFIGTASGYANSALEVYKTGLDSYLRVSGDVAKQQGLLYSDSADRWNIYKPQSTSELRFYNYGTTSDVMTLKGSNVAIGTSTTSNSILTLKGSGAETSMITFNHSNNTPYVGCGYDETNDGFCIKDNYGGYVLNRTVLFVKRDNSAGALIGIGTTNPKYNLHIVNAGTSIFGNPADKRGLLITDNASPRIILENTTNLENQRLAVIGNVGNAIVFGALNDVGTTWNKQNLLKIDMATGNVGIGTSSAPSATLDINGSATLMAMKILSPSEIYDVSTAVGSTKNAYVPKGTMVSLANTTGKASSGTIIDFNAYQNSYATNCYMGAVSGTAENGPANMVFGRRTGDTSWAESMRVNTAGSLLIGTNSGTAGSILDINGVTTVRGNILPDLTASLINLGSSTKLFNNIYSKILNLQSGADSNVFTGTQATFSYGANGNFAHCIKSRHNGAGDTNNALDFYTWKTTDTASVVGSKHCLSLTSTGVSIGSTTPTADSILTVNGNTTCIGNILPDSTANLRDIGSTSLKFNLIYGSTIIDTIATRVGGSTIPFMQCMNNVQINSGQNVLWNHTTNEIPSTKFQLLIGTTSVGTTSERMQLSAYRDNSYRPLQLNPTGKVIIGGSSVIPTSTLDIGGDCTIRGDLLPDATALTRKIGSSSLKFNSGYFEVLYTTSGSVSTSDRNKKTDIQPLESALDMVLKLNPVSYKFIDGSSGRTHLGLIAQEVSDIIPDCAIFVKDENGSCGLRYDQFIALLIKAVQEQDEKIRNIELQKPQLVRQNAISVDNSLNERLSNLEQRLERESIVEVKEEKSEQFELIQSLMDKVNFLVIKNQELENKIEQFPKVEIKNEIAESDNDGLSLLDTIQDRLYKAEQLINKQDKLIKKLVSATNRLLKSNE